MAHLPLSVRIAMNFGPHSQIDIRTHKQQNGEMNFTLSSSLKLSIRTLMRAFFSTIRLIRFPALSFFRV